MKYTKIKSKYLNSREDKSNYQIPGMTTSVEMPGVIFSTFN